MGCLAESGAPSAWRDRFLESLAGATDDLAACSIFGKMRRVVTKILPRAKRVQ
jgi:hypothetical protein